MVGAASRSVLPTIDGSHDYLAEVQPDPEDPFSPGLFVPEWDQGRVAVGNGDADSHWVHDDMEVSAVAFQERGTRKTTVVMAANLYMIFGTDGDVIRERVAERLGRRADQVELAISADHNHHGPDTAFDVNHEWYELMIDQATDAAVEAISDMRPARLEVAEAEHYFGLADGRDPQVFDPTLGVLKATATNGRTIATMLFWANHPETTLFWEPSNDAILDECAEIGLTPCTFSDRYFTADYPGLGDADPRSGARWRGVVLQRSDRRPRDATRRERVGGRRLGTARARPRAATGRAAAARSEQLPGAELPPRLSDRSRAGDGRVGALDSSEPVMDPTVDYDVTSFYTRMSNIGFRLLLVRGEDGLTSLGHTPAMLYTCPPTGPKDDSTCAPDDFATEDDPVLGEIRVGDHARTRVVYLRIGPVGMMWIPAEIGPESTIGLPAGYVDSPADWHREDLSLHANGAAYVTSGYVKNRMSDGYRWIVGLGNDELGYAVPLADYRVKCVADDLAGPGTCQALYDAEVIEHPDAVAGATCKAITEDPSLAGRLWRSGAGDRRQLPLRPGLRRGARPLRGDELRRMGPRGRHPRRRRRADGERRPGNGEPAVPGLVGGPYA